MKKQILNLGKALNKAEQKLIHGGNWSCESANDCKREAAKLDQDEVEPGDIQPVWQCIEYICLETYP
jgi:hypothetical protein